MRISTHQYHTGFLQTLQRQQTALAQTQVQVATGQRVQTPADDPVAAVHLLQLQRALDESAQFTRNADVASNRLALEEQSLADANSILQRAYELAVQAHSGSVDSGNRRMLASELRGRLQDLIDVGNRTDANGEFLFSGFATATQPFVRSAGTVNYQGDQGSRAIQIGPAQKVPDSHAGFAVFIDVPEGNGTFSTSANSANTGSGIIQRTSVINSAAWVPGNYTLSFLTPTTWQITNASAAVVASGSYVDPGAIAFNGVSIDMTGVPAAGDSFAINASGTRDLFRTMEDLITTLEQPTGTTASNALFSNRMNAVLGQLQQGMDHLQHVRAEVGARLSMLETAQSARDNHDLELKQLQSELRDLDYAEAITRMNQQAAGLQAAQASYGRLSQLTLFDYLK